MSEYNKGRAKQIYQDAPEGRQSMEVVILWLVKAVSFLLVRYINGD